MFTTEWTTGVVRVRVYNASTGHREVWDTSINSQFERVHVSLSAEYIVLSTGNKSYVYNQHRALMYSVTHDQVLDWFHQTHVTETGVFWGTVHEGYKLLIMNLSSKYGYVYVTDGGDDVGVYSADGTYLHLLHIDPPEGGGRPYESGAVSLSDTEDLFAFSTYDLTTPIVPIAVYRTHP